MRLVSAWKAAELLREGKVGLVPTETVVGLVSDAHGLGRLFETKARDPGKPIAMLCSSVESALLRFEEAPPLAWLLAERCWPGPLTMVLDDGNGGTVGLRVPDHPSMREVFAYGASTYYATSANLSGEPAPAALGGVDPRVVRSVDFCLPGTPGGGEASAVVDLSGGRTRLIRPGPGLSEDILLLLDAEGAAPRIYPPFAV
ncbi:MAG: TsaC protein (YrdC domain) required for threonylcarbamoyladenosine t(6)A37 modification in tRNA [uncultured Rubrobacteraceae bacterium]|uniref:L-threonylcarbamoyladenylate synthase n=1 Tax=uncultured Rubrobacteraceae bacterium TaxID=349277 RepID=A0A6J4Q458_9ACTN|nr:MAG: TsaC protein (YrdC domain) required for threonylcarbamoyladenosine t(6)A37 modification in tRNA [uncultured Rubrobacteraceae bacterium]